MIDILAVLSLAGAAAKTENPAQLVADAQLLYGLYEGAKDSKIDFAALAARGQLKPAIEALARLSAVANSLAQDQAQLRHITSLLCSV